MVEEERRYDWYDGGEGEGLGRNAKVTGDVL